MLCGHASNNVNNSHATALDCGACAGASGQDNARTIARMLNDAVVHDGLRERAIDIPDTTLFGAALHETVSDRVEILDTYDAPAHHRDALARLVGHLDDAAQRNSAGRSRHLPGPAVLLLHVDLDTFGAGDKLTPNIVADIGVISDEHGDLRVGLRRQSTHIGDQRHHQPVRLLAVIQAPLERIERIINDNPILTTLVGGSWIRVAGRSHPHERWSIRVVPIDRAEAIVAGIRQLLDDHHGVVLVSEIQVSRADYF